MRRFALTLAALCFASQAVSAPWNASPGAVYPSWILAGAGLDFDFQNGRYFQNGAVNDISTLITTSRASTGYADDLAGNWTSFGSNVARITNKGLRVEEARTNSIRNNSMQGAVAGTPGTPPTNWTGIAATGLTIQLVGTGTQNGIEYIDYRFSGTTGGVFGQIGLDSTTGIAAVNAQTWADSAFLAIVAGSTTNLTSVTFTLSQRDGGGAALANISGAPNMVGSLSSALTRFSWAATTSNASTAFLYPLISFGWSNGVAIDLTLRIGWPQLELGAFATSPIRTTSAAVTRAADVVTVTTPPAFGSAYTLFGKGTPKAPTSYATNQIALGVNNGTANERSRIRRIASTGAAQGVSTTGGVDTVVAGSTWTQSVSQKLAFAEANADQALSQAGAAVVTGAGALPTAPTAITIGMDQASASQFNGQIERIALWPTTRLPNADLQRITAP